jgi:hypothetical protein
MNHLASQGVSFDPLLFIKIVDPIHSELIFLLNDNSLVLTESHDPDNTHVEAKNKEKLNALKGQ